MAGETPCVANAADLYYNNSVYSADEMSCSCQSGKTCIWSNPATWANYTKGYPCAEGLQAYYLMKQGGTTGINNVGSEDIYKL